MKLAGLITAAGLSSRMGAFKPLLTVAGESIIRRQITALRAAGCEEIVVITGHRAEELEEHLAGSGVICLRNPDYATTQQFESAQIGLRWLQERCDLLLYTPVDVPFLSTKVCQALLQCGRLPARPVHRGQGGHPILFPASAIPAMLSYTGSGGMRDAVESCAGEPYLLEVDEAGFTRDVDTPEDFAEVCRLFGKG